MLPIERMTTTSNAWLSLIVVAALGCNGERDGGSPPGEGGSASGQMDGGGGQSGASSGSSSSSGSGGSAGSSAGAGGAAVADGGGAIDAGSQPQTDASASPDGGDIDAAAEVEAALEELRALRCSLLRDCCEDQGLMTVALEDCELDSIEESTRRLNAIADGSTIVDPVALEACLAAARADLRDCTDLRHSWISVDIVPPLEECEAVLEGTLEQGEACMDLEQCAQDGVVRSFCVRGDSSTCRPVPVGALGDACVITSGPDFRSYAIKPDVDGDVECRREDGLQCEGSAGDFECIAVQPAGGSCVTEGDCAADAYCDETCQPRKAIGEACTSRAQCASYGCSLVTSTCTDYYVPTAFVCEDAP